MKSTSQKLTHWIAAIAALVVLSANSYAQTDSVVQVSDQKAGSFLVFPYYASGTGATGIGDTRLTISNVGPIQWPVVNGYGSPSVAQTVFIHLFMIDSTCAQADIYLCLTPNASISFKTSDYDPVTSRGAAYAVVVDNQGYPIAYNGLIGNAFVNFSDSVGRLYLGNYAAESFTGQGQLTAIPGNNNFYTGFDGVTFNAISPANPQTTAGLGVDRSPGLANMFGYDGAPIGFAVEIQSPLDAKDQTIVLAGLAGAVGTTLTGTEQTGIGTAINGNEKPLGSFTGFGGGCISINILTATFPRVPLTLGGMIRTGQTGTLQFNVVGAVGLLMTPKQVGLQANSWSGIRNLHKTAILSNANGNQQQSFRIPVFVPAC